MVTGEKMMKHETSASCMMERAQMSIRGLPLDFLLYVLRHKCRPHELSFPFTNKILESCLKARSPKKAKLILLTRAHVTFCERTSRSSKQ